MPRSCSRTFSDGLAAAGSILTQSRTENRFPTFPGIALGLAQLGFLKWKRSALQQGMNVPHRGLVPPPMVVVLCYPTGRADSTKNGAIGTNLSYSENLISGSPFF
jgi:hypothetical protein